MQIFIGERGSIRDLRVGRVTETPTPRYINEYIADQSHLGELSLG